MEPLNERRNQFWVIGLGHSGIRILEKLRSYEEASWLNLLVIDTNRESIESSAIPLRIAAGIEWTDGFGCGGNATRGEATISRHRAEILEILSHAGTVLVVGGLGGGTATGGTQVITSIAKQLKIPCIPIMTLPFSFEGMGRRRIAELGLRQLIASADAVFALPNDLLFSSRPGSELCGVSFQEIDDAISRVVLGVAGMLRPSEGLIPVDVSAIKEILHGCKAECCIGIGTASDSDGSNRCVVAVERMLASPLLGGVSQIGKADALIVAMTGGNLSIGELKKTLETVSGLATSPETRILTGANLDPAFGDRVQVVAISIHIDPSQELLRNHAPSHFERKRENRKTPLKTSLSQPDLPLRENPRGIFADTPSLMLNNEDLDVPTTIRRDISIDKGAR
jgi:cell division protein FtsZ